jgi:hypothetical protein
MPGIYPKYWMRLTNLYEDAASDLRRSDLANEFIQALSSYLFKLSKSGGSLKHLATAEYNGNDHYCIASEALDVPAILKSFLLIFIDSQYPDVSGTAAVLQTPIGRARYVVTVQADCSTLQSLSFSVTSTNVRTTLRHELQHILDYTRFKDKAGIANRAIVAMKKTDTSKMDDAELRLHRDAQATLYHNDALETNAFFHNLAEPLLDRLRWLKRDSAAIEFFDDLPRDFRDYMAKHVAQWSDHAVVKQHWSKLNERNRRRAISRLKQLFDLFWTEMAKYTDKSQEAH